MGKERSRDGSLDILKAMAKRLNDNFNPGNAGLDDKPTIARDITDRTREPYVYLHEETSSEVWVTKDSESRRHYIMAQVVIRYDASRGSTDVRDNICNEIISILTDASDYPTPQGTGFDVELVTTGSIIKYATNERGAKFYIANIPIEVTARYNGFGTDTTPVFNASLSYSGFRNTPSNKKIEKFDSGTITVATTGYSDSNGWEFTSASVAKASGKDDGTLNGGVLTVGTTDESLGLATTAVFTSEVDSSETQNVTDTDNFNREISFRFGTIDSDTKPAFVDGAVDGLGLRNLANWDDEDNNRTIEWNRVNPIGHTFTVAAKQGEWLYMIYDKDQADISALRESVLNLNILNEVFESPYDLGDYKIYIAKAISNYNANYTYTIS